MPDSAEESQKSHPTQIRPHDLGNLLMSTAYFSRSRPKLPSRLRPSAPHGDVDGERLGDCEQRQIAGDAGRMIVDLLDRIPPELALRRQRECSGRKHCGKISCEPAAVRAQRRKRKIDSISRLRVARPTNIRICGVQTRFSSVRASSAARASGIRPITR
jgi:hypothetical protein